jgi:hypothetical protein
MAKDNGAGIEETWAGLRENPVFRRTLLPRGMRSILRSPLARAVGLTAVALAAFTAAEEYMQWWPFIFASALIFWFLIQAIQHYFGWLELTALARNGTLGDYLNSGLSRADVAIGVIYPAVIAETLAIIGVTAWFAATMDSASGLPLQLFLIAVIVLRIMALMRPPFLFHPDVEGYLRKRNLLSLFFISLQVLVPLIIWFAILIPVVFGVAYVNARMGTPLRGGNTTLAALIITMFASGWPTRKFQEWRLKRFYQRQPSFESLFEKYIEQEE